MTYGWTLVSAPAGSKVALSSASTVATQFNPDMVGAYVVRLRVSDPAGAFTEQELKIDVANHVPVVVLDKTAATVLAGKSVDVSAALSYDQEGDVLTYGWTLESRPSDSASTLADAGAAKLSFSPDRPGDYVLQVKVSDGKQSTVGRVNLKVLAGMAGSLGLSFTPLDARYSRSLDKLVTVSANPDVLSIIDPFNGVIKSVVLPAPYKGMTLSADGKTAAVLHEGLLSVIDLGTAKLLNSWATGGSQTEVALSDQGRAYLMGQTGGQWVEDPVTVLNVQDGTRTATPANIGFGQMYGTVRGVFSQKLGKGFTISLGLSPADISYYTLDQASGMVKQMGDSPYHGDYQLGTPLFLSASEEMVITGAGTYFYTDTLKYAGQLTLSGVLTSFSQSPNGEALAISSSRPQFYDSTSTYPAGYQRFTGNLMLPAGELAFPAIDGLQSYGINIFHSAAGNHVALVQTGSAQAKVAGVKYYVIYR